MKAEHRWESEAEGTLPAACEPVLRDGPRRRVLWLMVEYFRTLGYSDVKARLPGHTAPAVLSGTLEDHRPDLTCRQGDRARTPVLLEVVLHGELEDPGSENRWSLLASAARLYSAELHFVVPRWTSGGSIALSLRRRLRDIDVHRSHIWLV
ncbi:MAG TPA: hypothetical protein VLT82_20320 [Myxococcaceae bacterium]|nr:hypothetical protein [Myxococcaceae bacterium]